MLIQNAVVDWILGSKLAVTLLVGAAGLALLLGAIALARSFTLARWLRRVLGGTAEQDAVKHLAAMADSFDRQSELTQEFRTDVSAVQREGLSCLSTVDVEHYDAFQGQAGKFSFSLLMLNRNGSGIMLTSLTNAQGSKVYVKRIDSGKSDTALSREEQDLLSRHVHS